MGNLIKALAIAPLAPGIVITAIAAITNNLSKSGKFSAGLLSASLIGSAIYIAKN